MNPFISARNNSVKESLSSQEQNKNWWEKLPMTYKNWEKEERQLTSKEDFDELEKIFLDSNPWIAKNVIFSDFSNKKVLEIGCGSGVASCIFAKHGANVTAIDLTEKAIETAKLNAKINGLKINFICTDAENLDFPQNHFDYIFSWGVIHHSHKPFKILKKLSPILKPSIGKGLIMVYNKVSLRFLLKGLYWLIIKGEIFKGETLTSVQKYFTDGFFHKHYTQSELNQDLKRVGLDSTRFSKSHMAKKMIPIIPRSFDEFLKKTMGWFLIAEFKKGKL